MRRAVSSRAGSTSIVVAVGMLPVRPVTVSVPSKTVLVSVCQAVCKRSGESVQQSCSVGCASSLPGYWCAHSNETHSRCAQGLGHQALSSQSRQQTTRWMAALFATRGPCRLVGQPPLAGMAVPSSSG